MEWVPPGRSMQRVVDSWGRDGVPQPDDPMAALKAAHLTRWLNDAIPALVRSTRPFFKKNATPSLPLRTVTQPRPLTKAVGLATQTGPHPRRRPNATFAGPV